MANATEEELMSSEDEQPPEGERYCSLAGLDTVAAAPPPSSSFPLIPVDHEHEERDKKITRANTRGWGEPVVEWTNADG